MNRYVVRCGEYEGAHSTRQAAENAADLADSSPYCDTTAHEVVEQVWAPEHPSAYRGWVDSTEFAGVH